MGVDKRVQYAQAAAPVDESLARAVINFADSLAKGDAGKIGPMLDASAKGVLDSLSASGEWDESTSKIEAVRVVGLSDLSGGQVHSSGAIFYTAIQEPGAAYVLGWAGTRAGDAWVFTGAPSTPATRARASEFDGDPTLGLADAPTTFAAPAAEGGKPGEPGAPGAAPGADGKPGAPAPGSSPIRKRTPAGPVDVPTGPKPPPGS
ncbi:MAG: hypothetical protein WC718_05790, partial [Phycisphaerales bacterium]|jgi:hypothetical protein